MKRTSLLLLVLAVFLLASCSSETITSNQNTFLGGTTGLLVNFVEGEPPLEVTDGNATPFTVSIKLENRGETEIAADDILISLRGIDPISFSVTLDEIINQHPTSMVLKNDLNPDNGEKIDSPPVYFTFPMMNYQGSLAGNDAFPFVVDVCYKYRTLATSKLCVKENTMDSTHNDVCTVSEKKSVQNSGAPIQIVSFDESSAGQDAVAFSVKIKDMGSGLLAQQGTMCNDHAGTKNIVKLTVDTGISGLTCGGLSNPSTTGTAYSGDIRMSTGEVSVRCTQQLTLADKSDKVMIVDMFVDYDYQESKATSVLVKHI